MKSHTRHPSAKSVWVWKDSFGESVLGDMDLNQKWKDDLVNLWLIGGLR